MNEKIMLLPITPEFFELMFKVKTEYLILIMQQYDCSKQEIHDTLWQEFNIPGMENRIANTAFDFLIDCCEKKNDLEDTLRKEIKKNVLHAAIFYTNIEPNAVNTNRAGYSGNDWLDKQ